jgi:hypothetical protein
VFHPLTHRQRQLKQVSDSCTANGSSPNSRTTHFVSNKGSYHKSDTASHSNTHKFAYESSNQVPDSSTANERSPDGCAAYFIAYCKAHNISLNIEWYLCTKDNFLQDASGNTVAKGAYVENEWIEYLRFRLKVESVRFLESLILQVLEVKLQEHAVIPIWVHPTRLVLAEDLVKALEVFQGSLDITASHLEMH